MQTPRNYFQNRQASKMIAKNSGAQWKTGSFWACEPRVMKSDIAELVFIYICCVAISQVETFSPARRLDKIWESTTKKSQEDPEMYQIPKRPSGLSK